MKTLKNQKAFTLVELIVVIAIIGILSAVLIPSITGYISKAKDSAAMQEADFLKLSYVDWTVEKETTPSLSFYTYLTNKNLLQTKAEVHATVTEVDGQPTYSWNVFYYKATNGLIVKCEFIGQSLTLTLAPEGIPSTGFAKFPVV